MAKGKAKNSSDTLAPPQPRSLRSKKRECPSEEISETDVQTTLHHQDTERNNTAVDATLQSPLQESTMISAQQHQAEQSYLPKQYPDTEEHAEARNVSLKNVTVKAVEEQEETTSPNNDSQLEGFRVHTDDNANKSGKDKEEITAEECNRSPPQTYTDQLQVLLPTFEEGDRSCATALEEQLGAKENSLERNKETSHEIHCNVYIADVKEDTREAVVVLPAKKKRRMGMCGLTERERSHFLQTQKRENGQNGPDRAKNQICNNTADLVAQEEIISAPPLLFSLSIPAGSVTEQNKAEIKLQSSHYQGDDRAETEVLIAATISAGTSAVCNPDCSKGESCEAEGGIVPGVEQTGYTKSDPPTEEELLGNQVQQKLEGPTAESKAEEQMKDRAHGSAGVDQSSAMSFYSTQNEETENWNAIEAAPLQVRSVSRTRDEKKEEMACDAGNSDAAEAGASSTDTCAGELDRGSVELCEAAVSSSGSGRKDSCGPDDKPGGGFSIPNMVHPQTRDTTDPFESGYLDYVSDSQLNTIALTEEEEVMEGEQALGSPDCHDATDLICGLIRELSSLNQKVMATHRELENLRRSSKSSRTSIH